MESAKKFSDNYNDAIENYRKNQLEMKKKQAEVLEEIPPDTLSVYLYPTMIILPIVIVVILVLASKAHIAIKIIVIILLIFVIFVYHLQQNNIDILKFLKPRFENNNNINVPQ